MSGGTFPMATQSRDTESNRPGERPQRSDSASTGTIIDRVKRAAPAVVGGALLVRGLRRRSLRGAATAVVGGWLLSRALGGNARIERALRPRTMIGRMKDDRTRADDVTTISRSIIVGRPADELYEAWRDPEQFSQVMGHFAEVTASDEDRYRWTVHGPRGRDLSWETRIVEAEPGEVLRWETPADATVPNEGSVRFRPAPGDRGTVVTLSLDFDPPGGAVGNAALERLDIVPETLAGRALSRFKSLVETGEIPTLEGNPSARGDGDLL